MIDIKKLIKEKYHWLITMTFCTFLIFYAFSCDPQTPSIIETNGSVTRHGLDKEVEIMSNIIAQRYSDLEQQEKIRNFILQQSLSFTTTGTFNPVGFVTSLIALIGAGSIVDDVRVRKKLKIANTNKPVS